ncbi:MAG: hypothetical protein NWF08_01595 [Candidatus Bathyarchaeota archaeon]|nr:hypothetical protein [Candidatus Bathyarchaeota archaeon]
MPKEIEIYSNKTKGLTEGTPRTSREFMGLKGCNEVAKWHSCTPKPLPEGTVKDKVAFLLKQNVKRTEKDITKIIYPSLNEDSPVFKSKYSYVRKLVAKMRRQLVHFHHCGTYKLVWNGQPITLNELIKGKQECLLTNGTRPPEWMYTENFFQLLKIPSSNNGRKYVGSTNLPCTFEITKNGYITVYIHNARIDWRDWLEEQLVTYGWPRGLMSHIFSALESNDESMHMTIDGFSWPKEWRGKRIEIPYGIVLVLGDGSHPYSLELKFSSSIPNMKRIEAKLDILLQMAGWVEKG